MNRKASVLVVDDEPQILRVMRASLPPRGYDVRVAANGQEAIRLIEKQMPDLVILDLIMPGMSGLEVCRIIRKTSSVPIIVLSARGVESDKISALDLGADDYVTKPFSMDELLARMRAVLRRFTSTEAEEPVLNVGDITIDVSSRQVLVAGKEIKLTPKEFDVLKHLMTNAGKVVTRQTLLQSVWGSKSLEQAGYLRVFINQLRRKIEPDPENPRYILTEPWIGYKFSNLD